MSKYTKRKEDGSRGSKRQGKNYRKGKGFQEREMSNSIKVEKENDPQWYMGNEQLLKDAATLNFSNVTGLPVNLADSHIINPENCRVNDGVQGIAGIMALSWCPSVGYSDNGNSVINIAARNIYSNVRYANSGHTNYMANDLMMYLISVGQAYAWVATLMRVYGVINVYSAKNRYLPKALVEALGFDYDDILQHLPEFRYFINTTVSKLSVLWVPNTMPLYQRWFWLNSNVYADADDQRAQLYVFRQGWFYKYNPTFNDKGGGLECFNIPNEGMTYEMVRQYTTDIVDVLISDEDMGIMAGDILKAFGADRIFQLNEIPDNYCVMPVYEPEVLLQIHNTYATAFVPSAIHQDMDKGIIMCTPTVPVEGPNGLIQMRKYLDYSLLSPTPELNMVATRLMIGVKGVKSDGDEITYQLRYTGTEVVYDIAVFRFTGGALSKLSGSSLIENRYSALLTNLTRFQHHPIMYVYFSIGDVYTLGDVFGELNEYTTVGASELEKLHETAILSEFGVPYRVN